MKRSRTRINQNNLQSKTVVLEKVALENNNIELSINDALRKLKIKRPRADVKITEYKTTRFLFFKKMNRRIEITQKGEKEFLLEVLDRFLTTLGIKYKSTGYDQKKGIIILSINSPVPKNKLIGKRGKTINAMEYLLNKIALNNNIKVKVVISINS